MSRIRSPLGTAPLRTVTSLLSTPAALRRVAVAAVAANVGIVITGGAVRLTGSGLGCPTWPRCTADSYVASPAMGLHGAIEFGNRMLTFAVGLVAVLGVLTALAQRRRPPRALGLALLVLAGIPAQALVGGLTVLTDLNPWVVGGHFLVSMAIIAAAYGLWRTAAGARRARAPAAPPGWVAPPGSGVLRGLAALRALGAVTVAACAAVLVLGTVVTGSGPHAGDAEARRTGLDPAAVSQLHADGVFLLIGLSIGLWLAVRAVGGPARAAAVLLAVELGQGLIGFVQYLTDLPAVLVGAHMAGACAVWLAALHAYAELPRQAAVPQPVTDAGRGPARTGRLPAELTRPPRAAVAQPADDADHQPGLTGATTAPRPAPGERFGSR